MGLLDKFFGTGSIEPKKDDPSTRFGRFSDTYKDKAQYTAWDDSVKHFDSKNYLDSFEKFFLYLKDNKEDNVHYKKEGEEIKFELYQGSKTVRGVANATAVQASAKVVKADSLNVAYMRKLMEMNYNMKYSRFCLEDDNTITLKFDTNTIDASPEKLYFAIKELANSADKQDDLLVSEFSMLKVVDNSHVAELSPAEKEIKFKYLQQWINEVLTELASLKVSEYGGAYAYSLLNCAYKIDYLIAPEGKIMDGIEKIHGIYWNRKTDVSLQDKVSLMIKEFEKIKAFSKEVVFKELYKVKSTFGIAAFAPHQKVAELITNEIAQMAWYKENNKSKIANWILEYFATYSMFVYGLPRPTRHLLHLYIRIMNSDYFSELGFTKYYESSSNKFSESFIKEDIKNIETPARDLYPKLNVLENKLSFKNLTDFATSYLKQIELLDFTPKDAQS